MTIARSMLPEFDTEMANSRKVLERVPEADWKWRPHAKSWTLGELASHVVNLLEWTGPTLAESAVDIAPVGGEPWKASEYSSPAELLAAFDANVAAARAAIDATADEAMGEPWSLLAAGETLFTMPRGAVLRSFIFNHSIHHRAQLGVYLRLRDVPVPGVYGPSADETEMG